jgi:hypothetical protein
MDEEGNPLSIFFYWIEGWLILGQSDNLNRFHPSRAIAFMISDSDN